MTAYRGQVITYDEIGNPLSYYNGQQYTFTWENGRRLATASVGGTTLSFTYNDKGIRTSKTVGTVEHIYHLNGTQVVFEESGETVIVYLYDAEGNPIGMQYRTGNADAGVFEEYWFEKNLQGDIVAVYDGAGTKLISYTYDAWGNFTTTYHNGCTDSHHANLNPFRYRGYYYDSELGMYYLQSRYYDPAIGRFINADATEYLGADGTFQSFNLFAYCGNNPVMGYDPTGTINWGNILKAALVVVVVTVAVAAVVATAGTAAVAAGIATNATVAAATTGAVVGGLVAGASEIAWQCGTKGSDNLDYGAIAIETFVGSAHGAIDGVAATSASVARRTACKVGKIVLSGVGSTLHCTNQGMDARETVGMVAKSVVGAAAIQTCMLGVDLVHGMLNTSILESYLLDGKFCYGIGNMMCTAGLRALSNGYRNVKGIIERVF